MNCDQIEELIPAYVLGAVDDRERNAVEAHLRGCPMCLAAFQEHGPVVGLLSEAAGDAVQPSPGLRGTLMGRLRALPGPQLEPGAVGLIGLLRGLLRRPLGAMALTLAALFPVALGVGGYVLWSEVNSLRDESSQLSATQVEQMGRALKENRRLQNQLDLAYTAAIPGVSTIMLEGEADAPGSRGMLMISPQATWAILATLEMKPLPEDQAYQLWLISDGSRTSGGVFTVDETGYGQLRVRGVGPLTDYQAVGVSVEPAQGSDAPTGAKVLGAQLAGEPMELEAAP